MTRFLRPRFLQIFVLPNVLFLFAAWFASPERLISLGNPALLAVSIGVCVAYHRPVYDILFGDDQLETTDWLALGIFISWFGQIIGRTWSITWRWLGRPDWLENTHLVSYAYFMLICAAVFHLAAPGAIGQRRVPTLRWVKIGTLIAAAIFGATLLGYVVEWWTAG